jgi:BirA family biotin operon repressor/biotin-[acetyl-CoA-carboxylase] ligase
MRRFAFDTLDSTNAEAARRIAAGGIDHWTLITARVQTAGRGRQARGWVSPAGNAYASFVVPKDGRAEWARPWLLGFAVGLAVHETVTAFIADGADARIKWPNDITIADAKVAGLLLEAAGVAPFVVAGIGINVACAPTDTPYPATYLDQHRPTPLNVESVVDRLAAAVPLAVDRWLDQGFAGVRRAFLACAHRQGDRLAVRGTDADPTEGTFIDIDSDGLLVLDVKGVMRRFSTGDVFPSLKG